MQMTTEQLEKQILYLLNNTLVILDGIDWQTTKLSFLSNDIPGYDEQTDVDLHKSNNGFFIVGIEDLYQSENSDDYFIPLFSIGVLTPEERLKACVTSALSNEQLWWLIEQINDKKFEKIMFL